MSKQPSAGPLSNPEVIAKAAKQAAKQAAKTVSNTTVDVVKMQDLARATVTWASRLVTRQRRPRPERSDTSITQSEGGLSHYYSEAREFGRCAYDDAKSTAVEMYEEIKQDVTDLSPLPPTFDYSYALTSYFWLFLIMTAKTCGHRLARVDIIYTGLEAIFSRWVAAILLYIQLPAYTLLFNQKISLNQVSRYDRYIILMILAFVYGLFGEFIWLHWVHFSISAPYYYYPAIIGFMLQVTGPHLGSDRRMLLGTCVGSAIFVSLSIAAYNEALTIYYVGATIVSAMSSLLNLQLLIGDLRKHGADELTMLLGHYRAVIVSTYSHAIMTLICARYTKDAINEANTAVE